MWCVGFSLRWLLLLWSMGSRCTGFSCCCGQAQQLWHTGLVALQHVGSSWTRARTHVPCIGRRILNHCATGETPLFFTNDYFISSFVHFSSVSMQSDYFIFCCWFFVFVFLFLFWPHRGACGILVPCPEIEPMPPAVEAQSPNHWTTREVPYF